MGSCGLRLLPPPRPPFYNIQCLHHLHLSFFVRILTNWNRNPPSPSPAISTPHPRSPFYNVDIMSTIMYRVRSPTTSSRKSDSKSTIILLLNPLKSRWCMVFSFIPSPFYRSDANVLTAVWNVFLTPSPCYCIHRIKFSLVPTIVSPNLRHTCLAHTSWTCATAWWSPLSFGPRSKNS